jgi:C-terminal processing protease CtpA/Prc
MKITKTLLSVTAVLLLAGQAVAQGADDERAREMEAREAAKAEQLRAAEERLEAAARELMALSKERIEALGEARVFEYDFRNKPRLGVNIVTDERGPVEGVEILSVSPSSAADEAGMRAGDIITAVNDEALTADSVKEANMRLLDFMNGVESGDVLDLEYMRDGKMRSLQIEPRIVEQQAFAWTPDGRNFSMPQMPEIHVSPEAMERFRFSFGGHVGTWGDMEVVELTEGLGRYFGAKEGLLVISAPASNAWQLQDGDVILKIDGRKPSSVNHCMRILGSYQAGETLVLNIMRDKVRETIEIEVPDDRTSQLVEPLDNLLQLVKPVRAVRPAPAPAPAERT